MYHVAYHVASHLYCLVCYVLVCRPYYMYCLVCYVLVCTICESNSVELQINLFIIILIGAHVSMINYVLYYH